MNWRDWLLGDKPAKKSSVLANPLTGKPLRYLIGADDAGDGVNGEITEVPYGAPPVKRGISIGYCNLFDELNTGEYEPYLKASDTAKEYNEGQIDPRGAGWLTNLNVQFRRRKNQGFEYIELDNPDAYSIADVIGAIELAGSYGLKVIAKNPGLLGTDQAVAYVAHPNVFGVVVERSAGGADRMDRIRNLAGRPDLPVWFVATAEDNGLAAARLRADQIERLGYRNMSVTYSPKGEYETCEDVLRPRA